MPCTRAAAASLSALLLLGGGCNLILGNEAPGTDSSQGGTPNDDGQGGDAPSSGGKSNGTGGPGTGGNQGLGGSGGNDPEAPESRTVPCGFNDRGERTQILVDGEWENEGTCDDPDECVDDDVADDTPCAAGRGTGIRTCTAGAWSTATCVCVDEDEEYDGLAEACLVPIECNPEDHPFGNRANGVDAPIAICSAVHLQNINDYYTNMDGRFVLAKSLDLRGVDGFVPIGNTYAPFVGEFDGAGRALVGLTIDRSSAALGAAQNDVGLFGVIGVNPNFGANPEDPGDVHDLVLRDFKVKGGSRVGALAGSVWSESTIEDVVVLSGTVNGEGTAVGGLLGQVVASDMATASIRECSSGAEVSSPGDGIGGLIGRTNQSSNGAEWTWPLEHCSATGNVSGNAYVGGLIGQGSTLAVSKSWALGNVSGTDYVGGLVGALSYGSASQSWAGGNVSGRNHVGGVAGTVGAPVPGEYFVANSYSLGQVEGAGTEVGGLVGEVEFLYGRIAQSYSLGEIVWIGQGTQTAVGALVGGFYSSNGLYQGVARKHTPPLPLAGAVSGVSSGVVGSALLAPTDFADQSNFPPEWDFDTVWIMSQDLGRPILRWQLAD